MHIQIGGPSCVACFVAASILSCHVVLSTACLLTLNSMQDSFLCLKQCICEGSESSFRRKVQDLEATLASQLRASQHTSVLAPLNYRIEKAEIDEEVSRWTISILSKLTTKGSLKDFLDMPLSLEVKAAKAWCVQLLEGLHHYHQQGVAHGSVHLDNVLLWKSEALTITAKWSDGAYGLPMVCYLQLTRLKATLLECGRCSILHFPRRRIMSLWPFRNTPSGRSISFL